MEQMSFRMATDADREELSALLRLCFGTMAEDDGALSWIEGRYMVAEVRTEFMDMYRHINKRIVAMSGILSPDKSEYDGYEISWTATLPEYRKKGLIVSILRTLEEKLPDDGISLYCDCWRVGDNSDINLVSVMKHLGMHEVIHDRIRRQVPHNKMCKHCVHGNEAGCHCTGNLYMKER